jgi:hypothetical protein
MIDGRRISRVGCIEMNNYKHCNVFMLSTTLTSFALLACTLIMISIQVFLHFR